MKSISLSHLLTFQLAYGGAGILFNCASAFEYWNSDQYLTPTNPVAGSMVMVIYCLFLIPGKLNLHIIYRSLMAVSVVALGYGGIITHVVLMQSTPELYSSTIAGLSAIFINSIGFILNLICLSGRYQTNAGKENLKSRGSTDKLNHRN